MSHNFAAQNAMTPNWHHIQRAMHSILADKKRAEDSHKEHIALTMAMANKETIKIRQMIENHIKAGVSSML